MGVREKSEAGKRKNRSGGMILEDDLWWEKEFSQKRKTSFRKKPKALIPYKNN